MYEAYFGLSEAPFSITPDPQFLFMSQRHREAMAHLLYGIDEGGGFVQLTGEVGTGKTTLCRCVLQQLPEKTDVALIINSRINERELLQAICNELQILSQSHDSIKHLQDLINQHLLEKHAAGRRVVLIIDEAQNLAEEVLEQLRLLTNLETSKHKLLQIILIGQPELLINLQRDSLRQLAQRITARYHLLALSFEEAVEYIRFRLSVVGCSDPLFSRPAVREVYKRSRGIPRLINIICDRSLLGAYAKNQLTVERKTVRQAGREIFGTHRHRFNWKNPALLKSVVVMIVLLATVLFLSRDDWFERFHLVSNGAESKQSTTVNKPISSAGTAIPTAEVAANELSPEATAGWPDVAELNPQQKTSDIPIVSVIEGTITAINPAQKSIHQPVHVEPGSPSSIIIEKTGDSRHLLFESRRFPGSTE